MKTQALVIVEGGVVQDVLTKGDISYDVWDWDNFNENPIATWEDGGWEGSDLLALLDPSVLVEIRKTVADAKQELEAK